MVASCDRGPSESLRGPNRGAGPGTRAPVTGSSTKVPRAASCGWSGASVMSSTGVRHALVPAKTAAHSSRVRPAIARARCSRSTGQPRGSHCSGRSRGVEPEAGQQLGVEGRLQRPDGHVPPVRAGVGVVERGAPVQGVLPWRVGPQALGAHAVDQAHEVGRTIDHGRVDHDPATGPGHLEQRGQDAHDQVGRPASVVGDQVQRHDRSLARPRGVPQRAGDRAVVDVVAGQRRPGTGLAPAGHPAVDQARVHRPAVLRPEAEPLGDAGPEALDQQVGLGDQRQGLGAPRVGAQVDHAGGATAQQRVPAGHVAQRLAPRPIQPDARGTEVGQHHPGVRHRADPAELHEPHAGQGAGGRGHRGPLAGRSGIAHVRATCPCCRRRSRCPRRTSRTSARRSPRRSPRSAPRRWRHRAGR